MTPTSLVVMLSRSGIRLCLVLLVLTTDTPPPRQTPYTTFVSYKFSQFWQIFGIFVKKCQKKWSGEVCRPLFFDFLAFLDPPRGTPPDPPRNPDFWDFCQKMAKKGVFGPPPGPPQK